MKFLRLSLDSLHWSLIPLPLPSISCHVPSKFSNKNNFGIIYVNREHSISEEFQNERSYLSLRNWHFYLGDALILCDGLFMRCSRFLSISFCNKIGIRWSSSINCFFFTLIKLKKIVSSYRIFFHCFLFHFHTNEKFWKLNIAAFVTCRSKRV